MRNEREILADRFCAMAAWASATSSEERRTAYDALRLTAHADEMGDVRIAGIFDADLTEFLPMSWAVATAGACEYDPSTNVRLPTSHTGVVSARHPHPGASSPRDAGAVEVRGGDVAECRIGGFGPLVNPVGR